MAGIRVLMIDDKRDLDDCPSGKIARTYDEGINELRLGDWDILYLDHDLGDPDPAKTGYDICKWMAQNPEHFPPIIIFVTSNPAGLQNMESIINRHYDRAGDVRTWVRKEIIPT